MRLLYDSNGAPRVDRGQRPGCHGAADARLAVLGLALGAGSELSAASVMNPEGGGVSAWPSRDAARAARRGGARGLP